MNDMILSKLGQMMAIITKMALVRILMRARRRAPRKKFGASSGDGCRRPSTPRRRSRVEIIGRAL
jgi:hypothetical protein